MDNHPLTDSPLPHSRLSLQLQTFSILERASIILYSLPIVICSSVFFLLFPLIVLCYEYSILPLLAFSIGQLFGSLIADWMVQKTNSIKLHGVLSSLLLINFEILAFYCLEEPLLTIEWRLVCFIGGCLGAGVSQRMLEKTKIFFFNAGAHQQNKEKQFKLFERINSFSCLFGFSILFIDASLKWNLIIIQSLAAVLFLLVKNPDLILKHYIDTLQKEYKLKEVVVNEGNIICSSKEEEIAELNISPRRKNSTLREFISAKEGKTIVAVALLEAAIWSYFNYYLPWTIRNIVGQVLKNSFFQRIIKLKYIFRAYVLFINVIKIKKSLKLIYF